MVTRAEKIAWLSKFPAANYPEEVHQEDCDTGKKLIWLDKLLSWSSGKSTFVDSSSPDHFGAGRFSSNSRESANMQDSAG